MEIVKHAHINELITYKNLKTLARTTWLNDEVIYFYIEYIIKIMFIVTILKNPFLATKKICKNLFNFYKGC